MPVRAAHASRRAVLSAATVSGTAALLAACSGSKPKANPTTASTSATPTASASTPAVSSSASASATATATVKPKLTVTTVGELGKVVVTGAADKQPKITYPTPTVASKTVAKALIVGKGAKVTSGQEVTVDYTGYVGNTGKLFQSSYTTKQTFTFTASTASVIPGFVKSVVGFTVGSRVLIAIDPADGYGAAGQPAAGIPANATLLFVVDIHAAKAKLTHAVGTAVPARAGLPVVTVVKDVPKSIAKPTGTPPTTLVVEPLIKGTGPALKKGGPAVFQYIVDLWTTDSRNGNQIESSWGGTAATVPVLGASNVNNANALIAGLDRALVGQPVGSRILVVVPPALGYPQGNGPIKKTDTTVWCIDILDDIAA